MNLFTSLRQAFSRGEKPLTLAQPGRSKQAMRITAELMRNTDALTKKDIASWRRAWQMAINIDNPKRAALYDIYADCLIDAHLMGCIAQRKAATLGKDFILTTADGVEDKEATELLHREWFDDFCGLALDSRFWGHSLIQMGSPVMYDDGLRFSSVELVPRKHVCPEHGVFLIDQGDEWTKGISYREGAYAEWCVEVGKSDDLGLLLSCAPQCISKKNMLAFWDMFGEIFGAPMRIAKTNTQDARERANIEHALDAMGAAFWAVMPDGTDIDVKESSRGDAYNVYDKRVDRCNSEISKAILTQTMTIDDGSSLSQSQTHKEVFDAVAEADSKLLATIINDRLLPLMRRHGFPVEGRRFKWADADKLSPDEQRENERLLLQYYDIDPQYFIDKYHVSITGKRSEVQPESFFA